MIKYLFLIATSNPGQNGSLRNGNGLKHGVLQVCRGETCIYNSPSQKGTDRSYFCCDYLSKLSF